MILESITHALGAWLLISTLAFALHGAGIKPAGVRLGSVSSRLHFLRR